MSKQFTTAARMSELLLSTIRKVEGANSHSCPTVYKQDDVMLRPCALVGADVLTTMVE